MGGEAFTVKQKLKPFFRGLVRARPFREIALEGLIRGVSGPLEHKYAKRLARHGKPDEILCALGIGCNDQSQEMLAEGFKRAFENRLTLYYAQIDSRTSIVDKSDLEIKKCCFQHRNERELRILLRTGKITSENAQETLEDMLPEASFSKAARALRARS